MSIEKGLNVLDVPPLCWQLGQLHILTSWPYVAQKWTLHFRLLTQAQLWTVGRRNVAILASQPEYRSWFYLEHPNLMEAFGCSFILLVPTPLILDYKTKYCYTGRLARDFVVCSVAEVVIVCTVHFLPSAHNAVVGLLSRTFLVGKNGFSVLFPFPAEWWQ